MNFPDIVKRELQADERLCRGPKSGEETDGQGPNTAGERSRIVSKLLT